MSLKITTYSSLVPHTKSRSSSNPVYNQNHFLLSSVDSRGKTNSAVATSDTSSRNLFQRDRTGFENAKYISDTKQLRSNNNSPLLISIKDSSRPQTSIKTTPNMVLSTNKFQIPGLADALSGERKVLLYQQIERNKFSSNGAELMNRFNYKI